MTHAKPPKGDQSFSDQSPAVSAVTKGGTVL